MVIRDRLVRNLGDAHLVGHVEFDRCAPRIGGDHHVEITLATPRDDHPVAEFVQRFGKVATDAGIAAFSGG